MLALACRGAPFEDVPMAKKVRTETRQAMRRVLANLDRRWVNAASNELCGQLRTLIREECNPAPKHILAWAAYFPGEVDLSPLISSSLGEAAVYLPRVNPDYTMTFISVDAEWQESVEEGAGGIPQPRETSGTIYDTRWGPETLIVVPGLAFDESGNRLGRGGGYYDRFLADPALDEAVLVGACWSLQMVPQIPAEAHDVPMDWVCHERAFFAARSGVLAASSVP